jgi:hypothetical protein
MVNLAFGIILLAAQLTATGGRLPDVIDAEYSGEHVVVGQDGEVVVSLNIMEGYKINHNPPMQLKLESVSGLTLAATSFVSPPLDTDDPLDVYYEDVPDFTVGVIAARAGTYKVPGELVYFFCSTADGFCARHTLDVMVPVVAE